jgi:hypothetical protein
MSADAGWPRRSVVHNRSPQRLARGVGALVLSGLCACTTTAEEATRAAAAPCARARLARQFPTPPTVFGCYRVSEGPTVLRDAGVVVLADVVVDAPVDEAVRYAIATERPVVTSTRKALASQSFEQLAPDVVRLVFAQGTAGLEICADVDDGGALDGAVFVIDETPPFAHLVGRARLARAPCPGA